MTSTRAPGQEPRPGAWPFPAPALSTLVGRAVQLPPLQVVRRTGGDAGPALDPAAALTAALGTRWDAVRRGDTVALAVGSRGIADIAAVVRACVSELAARGAEPFVVPAMGSHGGATASGQRDLLAGLGITPEVVGAPVRSSMDTVHLGRADGVEVHLDVTAAAADHVLLVNRVKSHTSFTGGIESGLAKMLAIGLGKQRGAEEIHSRGPAHLEARIRSASARIRSAVAVLGGVALVEGPTKQLVSLDVLGPEEIGGEREERLLVTARSLEARLPLEQVDVLVVDVMGKEFSGTGMDTNVIGRRMVRGMPEPAGLAVTGLVVLEVSEASRGNAVGIGLADFAPARALERVDLAATYANALTAGLQGLQRAQVPIVLATDRDAVEAAVLTAGVADPADVRMVRIRNTLALDELMVTANLVDECRPRYEPVGSGTPTALGFAAGGRVTGWPPRPDGGT